MSSLSSLYIKTETLETILNTLKTKNAKGVEITISINDETNNYSQNLSSFISQSKEEREAKKTKFYVGNGKVFWTDGKITIAEKKEQNNKAPDNISDDDLPF